jgi:hypothetical protein
MVTWGRSDTTSLVTSMSVSIEMLGQLDQISSDAIRTLLGSTLQTNLLLRRRVRSRPSSEQPIVHDDRRRVSTCLELSTRTLANDRQRVAGSVASSQCVAARTSRSLAP